MMRLRNFEKLVTRRFLTALGFVSLGAIAAAKADCVSQRLTFANIQRSFVLCLPPGSKPALPVLLLLHGSGGSGAEIAALWEGFAAREGIILLAPDALHNDAWHLKDDSPDFLHALINGVQTRTAADRRRLYLFGQSGGAVYALTLAMLESQYFAAVAIHAGGWRSPAEFKVMSLARRRIPLKIILGARDEYFSTASGAPNGRCPDDRRLSNGVGDRAGAASRVHRGNRSGNGRQCLALSRVRHAHRETDLH
jgi:poly(3-hydroxybutyrate) depolymerase